MNNEKLNSWLSLAANLGVLVGIIILVLEVQQNNLIARAQMRSEISQSAINNIGVNLAPERMAISNKNARGEELTPGEIRWIRTFYRMEFRAWENVHYQYRIGLYDENEMESYRFFWQGRANACNDIYSQFYIENRLQFEPNFRAEMDVFFDNASCQVN